MEVLTLMLKRRVALSGLFRYHKHCEELQIINVFFTDDLFIFARGDLDSARVILESLDEFKNTSGLVPSLAKSTTFFCNVPYHIKVAIVDIIPFIEGDLPVKYLGVPLISSRLLNKDCKILVEKAKNRIKDWKNKSLSFAGRLQLCKSVISSMHVYWASFLIIPKVPVLNLIPAPNLDVSNHDNIRWRDLNGVVSDFSVSRAWEALRPRDNVFKDPRQVEVWKLVCPLAAMEKVQPVLNDIIAYLEPLANKKSARSIFGKLILATCSYFICLERNNYLFKNVKRTPKELRDAIMVTVRLKLLSFRFKNSAHVSSLLDRWKMPSSFRFYGN
ncbi:hypothetical protein Tco_0816584 [Tanacetum coccineum]